MAVEQPWFVGQRAQALAVIYLTRHPFLEVVPVERHERNRGYDLLVEIKGGASQEPAIFAVEAKGLRTIPAKTLQSGEPILQLSYSHNELRGSIFPVCVFMFATDDEQGFYRWLYKPTIASDGRPILKLDDSIPPNFIDLREPIKIKNVYRSLDNDAVSTIVRQVTRWYAAKHAVEAAAD